MLFAAHTGSNPATVVPVKAVKGCLIERSFLILIVILQKVGHLTVLHIVFSVNNLQVPSLPNCLANTNYDIILLLPPEDVET